MKCPHDLWRALTRIDLSDAEHRVFGVVIDKQFSYGQRQGQAQLIALAEFMRQAELSRWVVMQTIAKLERRGMLVVHRQGRGRNKADVFQVAHPDDWLAEKVGSRVQHATFSPVQKVGHSYLEADHKRLEAEFEDQPEKVGDQVRRPTALYKKTQRTRGADAPGSSTEQTRATASDDAAMEVYEDFGEKRHRRITIGDPEFDGYSAYDWVPVGQEEPSPVGAAK